MLITDTRLLENLQIISESKETGTLKIKGVFQRADEVNSNKRLYPRSVMEKQVQVLQEAIKDNRLCGELDHPSYDIVKLQNASHKITNLYMEGNDVIGEAELLDTPTGNIAKALIKGGVKIGISSRGIGTLSEGKKDYKTVNDDFRCITWDLVADPSTRGAFPGLSESKIQEQREFIIETTAKVLGEKVFTALLEKRLEEIAQSKLTIKKARLKGKALSKRGFHTPGNKPGESVIQYGKRYAREQGEKEKIERTAKKDARMGMMKDILAKRNAKKAQTESKSNIKEAVEKIKLKFKDKKKDKKEYEKAMKQAPKLPTPSDKEGDEMEKDYKKRFGEAFEKAKAKLKVKKPRINPAEASEEYQNRMADDGEDWVDISKESGVRKPKQAEKK